MIPKITSSNPFKGNVTIGRSNAERKQIANTIMNAPKNLRHEVLDSVVNLGNALKATTPDEADIFINVQSSNVDNAQYISILTTDNKNDRIIAASPVMVNHMYIQLDREEVVDNIYTTSAKVQGRTSSYYGPTVKKPETFEEVLDIIG